MLHPCVDTLITLSYRAGLSVIAYKALLKFDAVSSGRTFAYWTCVQYCKPDVNCAGMYRPLHLVSSIHYNPIRGYKESLTFSKCFWTCVPASSAGQEQVAQKRGGGYQRVLRESTLSHLLRVLLEIAVNCRGVPSQTGPQPGANLVLADLCDEKTRKT